jgi:hypothetical protein
MKTQMELGFENRMKTRSHGKSRRVPGARWWFQQMHIMVDHAFDWTSPLGRPEQIYLPLPSARRMRRCS